MQVAGVEHSCTRDAREVHIYLKVYASASHKGARCVPSVWAIDYLVGFARYGGNARLKLHAVFGNLFLSEECTLSFESCNNSCLDDNGAHAHQR